MDEGVGGKIGKRLYMRFFGFFMQSPKEEKTVDHVKKSDLVHSVVGTGPFRKIVLATPLENGNKNW